MTSLEVEPGGLTRTEAAQRLVTHGPNELPSARPRSWWRQARDVVAEPMVLLLVVAGTVNFVLADIVDGILLMASVVVVVVISLVQQHRTEAALTALRDLSSPRALVLRDGERLRIPGREVVPGDLVVLGEGDRVPADGLVVEAAHLTVDESALTGESIPVTKVPEDLTKTSDRDPSMGPPGGDDTPWTFSGTLVVAGRGLVRVLATGADTQLGRIGASLRQIETEPTPLQLEVRRMVRIVAVGGLLAAATVVVVYGSTRGDWLEGVLAGIATAMSMLPEEFPVVMTLFLAVGAWRMSRRGVLARRTVVVEALGSATVLCVDKTGTVTLNQMRVVDLITSDQVTHPTSQPLSDSAIDLAHMVMLATSPDPSDPMDIACGNLVEVAGEPPVSGRGSGPVREYPLTRDHLAVTQVWRDGDEHVVAVKGAPETVLESCRVDSPRHRAVLALVDTAGRRGERILGVAHGRLDASAPLPEDPREFAPEFAGLVGLADPVRPGAREAVAECARAGIRTVMITGDHPGTALAIADQIGLDLSGGHLTGVEVAGMSPEELASRAPDVAVFARMVPDQKLELVRALQAHGEVVAMTGDGVNDAPALHAADIGIAMGQRGTDVAREAADLVITDDDISSIAAGVRLGRGIFDNLRKAMAYIVAIHVCIVGLAVFPLAGIDWPLVLLPVQIAFLELVIDPACSVVFQAEPPDPGVMDRPPRRVGAPIMGRESLIMSALQGGSVLIAVLGVYLAGIIAERPDATVRAMAFSTLMFANLGLILVNRSWRLSVWRTLRERRNPTVVWILGGALVALLMVTTVPVVRRAFDFGAVSIGDSMISLGAATLGLVWFEIYKVTRRGSGISG